MTWPLGKLVPPSGATTTRISVPAMGRSRRTWLLIELREPAGAPRQELHERLEAQLEQQLAEDDERRDDPALRWEPWP